VLAPEKEEINKNSWRLFNSGYDNKKGG
jgi:hypothetical protein